MQTKYFEYIREIAFQGSITKAADKLYISQQALSRIVEHLETELGFKIFERTNKGVIPTKKGKELLKDIDSILLIMNRWEIHREEKKQLTVLIQYILSDLISDDMFMEYIDADGVLDIQWETARPPEIINKMKVGEPCLGIIIASPQSEIYPKLKRLSSSKKIKVEILATNDITQMYILLRADDDTVKKNVLNLEDLQEKVFFINKGIIITETPRKILEQNKFNGIILPHSVNAVNSVVQKKNAFTCLPYFVARNNVHVKNGSIVMRPLEKNMDEGLSCYLLYNFEPTQEIECMIENMKMYFLKS